MFVFLFDIDGTLIHTGGAGGAALLAAFREEFGIEQPAEVMFSGRTDRGIARDLFTAHGVPDTAENWERLRLAYLARLGHYLPKHQGRVLPGVVELLEHLARRHDAAIGLLTGNVQDGARLKLTHYALHQHFAFGGFGDLHPERNDVAHDALRATRAHLRREIAEDRVWVIGDTPSDVRCGRAIGARVLAVATGIHPRDELECESPDLLLNDLQDPSELLRLVSC
jgi:phosphoglycolate phosphatase-like HAD superfamily hydrolase